MSRPARTASSRAGAWPSVHHARVLRSTFRWRRSRPATRWRAARRGVPRAARWEATPTATPASMRGRPRARHQLDESRPRLGSRTRAIATLEPGVTIEQLWKHILPDGYWPKVVSGTMFPTVAGAAAMNIHGKNNFCSRDHRRRHPRVRHPDARAGSTAPATASANADLFHAAIGGFGMLGSFTRIVLETKKVYSGDLRVRGISTRNLREMMDYMEAHRHGRGLPGRLDRLLSREARTLGRGLIHHANYLEPGEDPDPARDAPARAPGAAHQHPRRVPEERGLAHPAPVQQRPRDALHQLDQVPLRSVWRAWASRTCKSHAGFAFLLDYVPNWKYAYGRQAPCETGLIQYQSFLPAETAHDVYLRADGALPARRAWCRTWGSSSVTARTPSG